MFCATTGGLFSVVFFTSGGLCSTMSCVPYQEACVPWSVLRNKRLCSMVFMFHMKWPLFHGFWGGGVCLFVCFFLMFHIKRPRFHGAYVPLQTSIHLCLYSRTGRLLDVDRVRAGTNIETVGHRIRFILTLAMSLSSFSILSDYHLFTTPSRVSYIRLVPNRFF